MAPTMVKTKWRQKLAIFETALKMSKWKMEPKVVKLEMAAKWVKSKIASNENIYEMSVR